jgi:hypothetical protein
MMLRGTPQYQPGMDLVNECRYRSTEYHTPGLAAGTPEQVGAR